MTANDHQEMEWDPKQSARDLVGDPLAGIDPMVVDVMGPYLSLAKTYGQRWADSVVAQVPLPWTEAQAGNALNGVIVSFDEMVRQEVPGLSSQVMGAMHKQLFISFSEQMDRHALATNSASPSSAIH